MSTPRRHPVGRRGAALVETNVIRRLLAVDILKKVLQHDGYQVRHIVNLTDIDDKTIGGAVEQGVSLDDYTAPYIESFFRDLDRLHVRRADEYPRATRHVAEMIELVRRIKEAGGQPLYRSVDLRDADAVADAAAGCDNWRDLRSL